MRTQTKKLHALLAEYKQLKAELFKGCFAFEIDDADPKHGRYTQLFQFFNPTFRDASWVNPLDENKILTVNYSVN